MARWTWAAAVVLAAATPTMGQELSAEERSVVRTAERWYRERTERKLIRDRDGVIEIDARKVRAAFWGRMPPSVREGVDRNEWSEGLARFENQWNPVVPVWADEPIAVSAAHLYNVHAHRDCVSTVYYIEAPGYQPCFAYQVWVRNAGTYYVCRRPDGRAVSVPGEAIIEHDLFADTESVNGLTVRITDYHASLRDLTTLQADEARRSLLESLADLEIGDAGEVLDVRPGRRDEVHVVVRCGWARVTVTTGANEDVQALRQGDRVRIRGHLVVEETNVDRPWSQWRVRANREGQAGDVLVAGIEIALAAGTVERE